MLRVSRVALRTSIPRREFHSSRSLREEQVTLALIKPDVTEGESEKKILDVIQKEGFHIDQTFKKHFTKDEIEEFYSDHKGRFFYQRLVSFMSRYCL